MGLVWWFFGLAFICLFGFCFVWRWRLRKKKCRIREVYNYFILHSNYLYLLQNPKVSEKCFSYDSSLKDVLHSKRFSDFILFNAEKKRRLMHWFTRSYEQTQEQISNSGPLFNLGEKNITRPTSWKRNYGIKNQTWVRLFYSRASL